jgi:hypothetical protein
MICARCGSRIPEGASFCPNCGLSIERQYVGESDVRLGAEAGEWLERYVQNVFETAGFHTERDYKIPASAGGAIHEIDVLARSTSGSIAIECKDMEASLPKGMIDAFIQKFRDLQEQGLANSGAFVLSRFQSEGEAKRYVEYLQRYGIRFFDRLELEKLWDRFRQHHDSNRFHNEVCEVFGLIPIEPGFDNWMSGNLQLGKQMTKMDVAKKVSHMALKGTLALGKALWKMAGEEKPKRRRKRRKAKRSRK